MLDQQGPPAIKTRVSHSNKPPINVMKWALGCAGVGMMFCTGAIMFSLIVAPALFRSLDSDLQFRIVRRFPFLTSLQDRPTPPFKALPAVGATSANALALLSTSTTPVSSPTAPAPLKSVSAGDNANVGTPLVQPSATGRPMLSTDTPVAASVIASPTEVFIPQPTATLVPTRVEQPSATAVPLPASFHATGYKWVPQTWNNCGPANLTQALEPFGWQQDQKVAAAFLKPNKEDKNVSPWQMVEFVNQKTNLKALMRVAGDLPLIKRLITQRFSVILETGYNVANEGWMGHYLTVIGYDDHLRVFYGLDTYLGADADNQGYKEPIDDLDERWQQFNRLYMVIYPKEREGELAAILGPDADLTYNAQHALSVARAEATYKPNNQFAWFNMGSSYTLLGQYKEAATAFDQASSVGGGLPFRMLWYQFTPYEAYYNVGNYANVMALVNASLQTTTYVEETYYWRGMVSAAQGSKDKAIEDFKRVLQFNPNFLPAAEKLSEVQAGNFKAPAIAQANQ
jgi:tetratricopeptide (TPR) repeat protein